MTEQPDTYPDAWRTGPARPPQPIPSQPLDSTSGAHSGAGFDYPAEWLTDTNNGETR